MDKLKILLVEDEPAEAKAIIQYADTLEEVRVVAYTNTEEGALREAQDHLPDAIILDLEFRKGSGDGLSFLNTLRGRNPVPYPFVLVTTNNTSNAVCKEVRKYGEVYIMSKSERDYSPEKVLGFLISMKDVIISEQKSRRPDIVENIQSPNDIRKRLTKRVSAEMELIGISPKLLGLPNLIEGILMVYDGDRQKIVAKIAKKCGKNEAGVERAMQSAINYAWANTEPEVLARHYTAPISSGKGSPTITEFLFYYAGKLKEQYGDKQ